MDMTMQLAETCEVHNKMSGPACGVQEHNEARRRETSFMRRAPLLQVAAAIASLSPNYTDF